MQLDQNKPFIWLAGITVLLLLIPLTFMQVTTEVNWGLMDFIVMGMMLFVSGSLLILGYRTIHKKYYPVIVTLIITTFLLLWAELAVGLF